MSTVQYKGGGTGGGAWVKGGQWVSKEGVGGGGAPNRGVTLACLNYIRNGNILLETTNLQLFSGSNKRSRRQELI